MTNIQGSVLAHQLFNQAIWYILVHLRYLLATGHWLLVTACPSLSQPETRSQKQEASNNVDYCKYSTAPEAQHATRHIVIKRMQIRLNL
jgi:hypothetical protein